MEVVPLFYTGPRARCMYYGQVCLWWSYFYCYKNPAIFSILKHVLSLFMEIPEETWKEAGM